MKKIILIAAILVCILSQRASAMTKDELNTLIATAMNKNGLLCAEVVNVVPLKVGNNIYEVTCIEYRGGTGKKTYIYNAATGKGSIGTQMQTLSLPSIVFYCLFGIFVFYQKLHVKNFRGESQSFALALNISAFAGMLTGVAYLLYYGWSVVWWASIAIFVIGLVASMLGFLVERVVGALALSVGGFIGWPICAYFMFCYVPSAT